MWMPCARDETLMDRKISTTGEMADCKETVNPGNSQCSNCGKSDQTDRESSPARGSTCIAYGKIGHMKRMCHSKTKPNRKKCASLHSEAVLSNSTENASYTFSTMTTRRKSKFHIQLDKESALVITFNDAGFGRFCFNWLPMGIISSQDVFQMKIDATFGNIPCVFSIADDLVLA